MIWYVIFGALTTLVNLVVYDLLFAKVGFGNVFSNICAWFLSVLFAYVTNKLFVFESKEFTAKVLFAEVTSFFMCRLATGLMDLAIMYFFVDVDLWGLSDFKIPISIGSFHWTLKYYMIVKIISNVLVIILNYIASKLVIFKKKEQNQLGER